MSEFPTPDGAQRLSDLALIVRCLKCGTKYQETEVDIYMEAIFDEEGGDFVCYEVLFTHHDTMDQFYVEDLLCIGSRRQRRCSIFGRNSQTQMGFAFPCLSLSKDNKTWISSADSKGKHFAAAKIRAAS